MMTVSFGIGQTLGPIATGFITDKMGSLSYALNVSAVVLVLGVIACICQRPIPQLAHSCGVASPQLESSRKGLVASLSAGCPTSQVHLTCIWRINRSSLKVFARGNVHADPNKRAKRPGAPALSKGKAMTMLNTTPRYAVPTVRGGFANFLARLGCLVNRAIAAVIAHRERQANLVALRHLSDRDLKDIGIYRCEIDDALVERAQDRQRIQQSQRS